MHVEHFMTKNPVACEADDTVRDAARLMAEKGVGSVVVLRNGKVAGIVTDRQLCCEVLANGAPGGTPVAEVMTPNPAVLTLNDNIFSAVDTMRSAGVARRVPVVSADNELLGVVSISDIAVIAKDLMDGIFLEETHHAMRETRILTGGKRISDAIRRPTKMDRLPPEQEVRPVTVATPMGATASGGAGEPPRRTQAPDARARAEARGERSGEGRGEGGERPGWGNLFGLLGGDRRED